MKNILITGGAGFIGSRLTRALLAENSTRRILIYDSLHPQVHGENAQPPDWGAETQFVQGDVRNRDCLWRAIAEIRPDTVYHLAAETGTGQSKDCLSRYCEVNVTGTANLLEGLRTHAKEIQHVILSSSRAVYGEGAYRNHAQQTVVPSGRDESRMRAGKFDVVDEQGQVLIPIPTSEDLPPSPASVYGSTKLMQEYLVQQEAVDAPWHPVILRFQNVYGPGQSLRNPYTGVLAIFCSQILSKTELNIYEDGKILRDFVYIEDVVHSLLLAGNTTQRLVNPINIGSGVATTILNAANILLDLLGGGNGYRISGQYRAGDIRSAVAEITRAREKLGWEPRLDLNQGLRLLAEWAREELLATENILRQSSS